MKHMKKLVFVFVPILMIASAALTACSQAESEPSGGTQVEMASMEMIPLEVKNAPETVQTAYRFAVANPEVLKQIPCYCGCGSMGHTSNYSCYIESVESDGTINFDNHSLGCSICVDITQDTIRLLEDGSSVDEIRVYIDDNYAKYGPSNIE